MVWSAPLGCNVVLGFSIANTCIFFSLQVLSPLGNLKEALSDIKIALDLKPSAHLHLMRGTLLFMQEVWKL